MTHRIPRRDALKQIGAAGAGLALGGGILRGQSADIIVAGQPVEIAVSAVSDATVRITIRPLQNGAAAPVPVTGALVKDEFGPELARARTPPALSRVRAGELFVRFTDSPPTIHIERSTQGDLQLFTLDPVAPGLSFLLGDGPLLGLGEGGAGFDRRGTTDQMRNGQVTSQADGYSLAINGTRAPIQWLISTGSGWGLFIHQPYGSFDLKGAQGKFTPPAGSALPIDLFFVRPTPPDPTEIMREYAKVTGLPEMPARWTFGYQQSSRTLGGPEEILGVANTFREKKLPCDALIYLGTEFAPSGWNTRNGEFTWHPTNFPEPKKMLDTLHADHFKVIVHVVIEGRRLTGTVADPCTADPLPSGRTPDDRWPPDRQVSCYWPVHKSVMDAGVDGWWPDQGDGFDGPSRLNRHRMYWEGTQLYRPNERPYALHRNASAGAQRYGGFIWSGDVQSRWTTLKAHIPVAINTGLSGLPYWGTDIGGFNPTPEYTGELHVRWFQFGAFNPLFRSHGRNWHLRLPWGWNGGDGGPPESGNFRVPPEELQNVQVEPICRKYLELRSQLMPYLYTAVAECHGAGMPIVRALWLHAPGDPIAAARGDEYFWGPHMLVAPVVERGATTRNVYLPKGTWFDFWTNERIEGGREIDRPVDLATIPLYVRAGAVLPMGPIRQYSDEPSDEPTTFVVYPGANGLSSLYDDDGKSFDYRQGKSISVSMDWREAARELTLHVIPVTASPRRFNVQLAGSTKTQTVTLGGAQVTVRIKL
jgi:alpha-glucosidase (family GH31 glycosyl hydrolase)